MIDVRVQRGGVYQTVSCFGFDGALKGKVKIPDLLNAHFWAVNELFSGRVPSGRELRRRVIQP